MLQKFLITLVAFITLFFSQSPVWAAVNQSHQTSEELNIQIDKSTFLAVDDAPAIIARRDRGSVSHSSNSAWWIVNFFILGLGQIIMGDVLRGFKFWLFTLIGIVVAAIPGLYSVGYIIILVVYIWSIVDAYNMSQEDNDKDSMSSDQRLAKINKLYEERLTKLNEMIKVSDNGMVSVKAFSF